ncbi:MAG: hypothetical protein FWD60_06930 [Candidatus Azobacteroides sp.]|nr:hypothetical protein [Candidatus Azobacteroides sp.]
MNMKKIVAGILIMMVGAFLLLNKMDFFIPEVYRIVISWQMLLIAIGIILLVDKPQNHKTAGLVLIVIGALFLFSKIFPLFGVVGFIIPVIITAIGISFIIKATTQKNEIKDSETWCSEHPEWSRHFTDFEKNITTNSGGVVHKEYVFSGSKEKWTMGKLRNVFIEATFSGVELDFTQAELADDLKVAAFIKVKSVFSGVTLFVPEDWNIKIQKTGAFGGFNDMRPSKVLQASTDKLVILEIDATFGGVEMKCYE